MSRNVRVQSDSRMRQELFTTGQELMKHFAKGFTKDAIVLLSVLVAVSLVSGFVMIQTLFP